jgi:hypothetical protein
MAWKWYEITEYKTSVGGEGYVGSLQLYYGDGYYSLLQFQKDGSKEGDEEKDFCSRTCIHRFGPFFHTDVYTFS